MSSRNTTNIRTIMVTGFAANELAPAPAIRLVDEACNTLQHARIEADGSCELSEDAVASAHDVLVGPVTVTFRADEFRAVVASGGTLDIGAPAARPADEMPAAARAPLGSRFPDGDYHNRERARHPPKNQPK